MHLYHKLQLFLLLGSVFQNAFGAKIINGRQVTDGSMLYMASLQSNGQHICGGFLISGDFVLTAAHCEKVSSVVLGTHHLSSASNDMKYDVDKKCKHPSYVDYSRGNDIMLLKLSRKAQGASVQTVALGPIKPFETYCHVAGWGYVSSHSSPQNDLRQATVPIVKEKDCRRKWGRQLPPNTICASGLGANKGFCQCDSGGPLVCDDVAVGIVSFNRNRDCNYPKNDFPNVYTDISKFLPWINGILANGDC